MAVVAFGPLTISFDGTVLRPRLWTLAQAEWAADLADGTALLELGCGAGQIGLAAAALSGSPVVQVDRDAAACAWAARNAAGNGYASLATQRCGTVAGVLGPEETFSLVVADPPYVPSSEVGRFPADPLGAIDGGADGLAEARAFLTDVAPHLRPGASVLLQVRGQSQADQLADWLAGPAGPEPALALTETRSFAADRAVVRLAGGFRPRRPG